VLGETKKHSPSTALSVPTMWEARKKTGLSGEKLLYGKKRKIAVRLRKASLGSNKREKIKGRKEAEIRSETAALLERFSHNQTLLLRP